MDQFAQSKPQWRTTPLALYGLVGTAIAAFIHLETYFGLSIEPSDPLFFIVHLAVFPLFITFIWRAQRWLANRSWFSRSNPSHWRELLKFFPVWVYPVGVALFAYTVANFLLSIQHLPEHSSGLTAPQARYLVRAFSGHWLLFYSIPTMFFGFVPKDARPGGEAVVTR